MAHGHGLCWQCHWLRRPAAVCSCAFFIRAQRHAVGLKRLRKDAQQVVCVVEATEATELTAARRSDSVTDTVPCDLASARARARCRRRRRWRRVNFVRVGCSEASAEALQNSTCPIPGCPARQPAATTCSGQSSSSAGRPVHAKDALQSQAGLLTGVVQLSGNGGQRNQGNRRWNSFAQKVQSKASSLLWCYDVAALVNARSSE